MNLTWRELQEVIEDKIETLFNKGEVDECWTCDDRMLYKAMLNLGEILAQVFG